MSLDIFLKSHNKQSYYLNNPTIQNNILNYIKKNPLKYPEMAIYIHKSPEEKQKIFKNFLSKPSDRIKIYRENPDIQSDLNILIRNNIHEYKNIINKLKIDTRSIKNTSLLSNEYHIYSSRTTNAFKDIEDIYTCFILSSKS